MIRTTTVLSIFASAGVATTALAQPAFWADLKSDVVAYDPFLFGSDRGAGEYTAGTDMRTMGAAAFGWQPASFTTIDGFGLSYAGPSAQWIANGVGEDSALVDYEAGGRIQFQAVGNFPFDRAITRQLKPTVSSSEWYMSVQLNRLGWADSVDNTFVVGGFTDATNSGIQIGYDDQVANDSTPDLALRVAGQNYIVQSDAASNDNFYVIAKLTVNTSGDDLIEVFVDQDPTALGVADFSLNTVNLTDSLTPFTQSRFESPGQAGNTFFDELLLTTSLDAISNPVPEPASLALLAAGSMVALGRRRRA